MAIETGEFRRLIEQHQQMVYSLALRVAGERGAAEEIAQDVFLELFRTLGKDAAQLQSEDHVRFWLRRVAVHRATDALRRQAVRPEAAAEEWLEETSANADEKLFAEDAGRFYGLEARLDELLQSLPERWRVAVVLRYQEEMMPEEIAALLNQPLTTVKSNLKRGLQMMRQKAAITMKEYVR